MEFFQTIAQMKVWILIYKISKLYCFSPKKKWLNLSIPGVVWCSKLTTIPCCRFSRVSYFKVTQTVALHENYRLLQVFFSLRYRKTACHCHCPQTFHGAFCLFSIVENCASIKK